MDKRGSGTADVMLLFPSREITIKEGDQFAETKTWTIGVVTVVVVVVVVVMW